MSATVSITPILRAAFPTCTAKNIARVAGVSVRTVHGWLAERCQPSSAALLRMADRNEILRRELVLRLIQQEGYSNDGMGQGVLPLDGGPSAAARGASGGTRHGLASAG
jgi:hypothetical protein